MKEKYMGVEIRGIRVLLIVSEADQVRSWAQIRKTIVRVLKIRGFAIFPVSLTRKDVFDKIKPDICIIPDDDMRRSVERLAPQSQIIVSEFLVIHRDERSVRMNQLEAQLREFKKQGLV